MDKKRETIADIIAEMRGFKRYATSDGNDCRYVAYWLYQTFVDRLEAAQKREQNAKKDIIITANGDALMNAYNALDEADGIIRRSMNRIESIANISIRNEGR